MFHLLITMLFNFALADFSGEQINCWLKNVSGSGFFGPALSNESDPCDGTIVGGPIYRPLTETIVVTTFLPLLICCDDFKRLFVAPPIKVESWVKMNLTFLSSHHSRLELTSLRFAT